MAAEDLRSAALIQNLIESANDPTCDPLDLNRFVEQIIESGVQARNEALQSMHRIPDLVNQISIASSLIACEPGVHEGIYEEALTALSKSDRHSDVALLSEITFIFDGHAPRRSIRAALNAALHDATGNLEADLRARLHRYGRVRLSDRWKSRFTWSWLTAGVIAFAGWWFAPATNRGSLGCYETIKVSPGRS